MNLIFTKSFEKDYTNLPDNIKNILDKQLIKLIENIQYPSLHTKKIKGSHNILEARITRSYRFTFEIQNDNYILRRAGTHSILGKE